RAAERPCGSDAHYPTGELAGVLRAVADGPLALPARSPEAGLLLCRSVLSALPPDDRARLSFCSRFSHPRRVGFRLAVFLPEDQALVEAGLDGHDAERLRLTRGGGDDPFTAWAGQLEAGVEPLAGLSLLDRPGQAVALADALDRWVDWLEAGSHGRSPAETAEAAGLPLVAVAGHPSNRVLPKTGRLLLDAALRRLDQRTLAALASESPGEELLAAAAEAAAGAPPEEVARDLGARVKRGAAPPTVAAALAFALASRGADAPPAIYSLADDAALWSRPGEAAAALTPLATAVPRAFLDLAVAWFTAWRNSDGVRCLDPLGPLLARFADSGEELLRLALQAVEQAAPQGGDERRRWFLVLVRRLRAELGDAYPRLTAARLVAEEGLLGDLDSGEAAELAPALAATFGDHLAPRVTAGALPWPALRGLLFACTHGLLPRRHGGDGWTVDDQPARWRLAARVAEAAASQATEAGDERALAEVVWLVWAASQRLAALRSASDPLANPQAVDSFAAALDAAIAAGAPEPEIALRAAWRLYRLGVYQPVLPADRRTAFRRRALAAAAAGGNEPLFAWGTRARIAHLASGALAA
ncbi:MAG TPA: hypothetical protein VKU40_16225, partial [Thermoanaerobaculia bacterium]|nr:hypothetical protein [Thermoanaerobaculia bacterium]